MQASGLKEITFQPDFIAYKEIYSTDCELIFSDSFIEAKGVAAYGDGENFQIHLRIEDIIEIESQWLERVKLHYGYFLLIL